ncbi:hypothetical protein [Saccharomonospora iraqiensis]|uniref:hypothetical protein n=1 Tax=Saccharomonospora iraqiensis TaxID=52698 RepID=UPI0002DA5738|nr:hypothetical protein [Saccharomonospora iraqiensis]
MVVVAVDEVELSAVVVGVVVVGTVVASSSDAGLPALSVVGVLLVVSCVVVGPVSVEVRVAVSACPPPGESSASCPDARVTSVSASDGVNQNR